MRVVDAEQVRQVAGIGDLAGESGRGGGLPEWACRVHPFGQLPMALVAALTVGSPPFDAVTLSVIASANTPLSAAANSPSASPYKTLTLLLTSRVTS
ncbi:hypothetical protein [Nonomuraea dietziae]|uniref:hypothetical protein n=1 Tax=Nonomuraea dietziae TaxID=65515 RepID=UPI003411595F